MKQLFALPLLALSMSAAAGSLTCSGLTSAGYAVETQLAVSEDAATSALTLKISSPETAKVLRLEDLRAQVSTHSIAKSPFKYIVADLSDQNGVNRGVLVARNALCSTHNDMKCDFNAELALEWNASFPYRMKCQFTR